MDPDEPLSEPRVVIRVSAVSAAMGVAVVVAMLMAQRIFVAAHRPLSWAAAAVVAAVLIDPIVGVLGRRIPRVVAVALALLVVACATFGIVYRAFDEMSSGLDRLGEAALESAEQVEDRDDNIGDLARDIEATRRVEEFVETLESRATGGEDVLASTAGTAPTYFVGAIMTIFFMSYGPRLAGSALVQVPGRSRRDRIARIVGQALGRARRAVLMTLAEGIVVGGGVALAATALDVPAPAALALSAGIVTLLPHVGLVLGSLPFLLLMLGLRSDAATIAVAVVVVVLQALDSVVVRPWVARRSVHVGLLVPWAVTLVGYAVYGVGGAAYGLAFAVFALALIDEKERDLSDAAPATLAGPSPGTGPGPGSAGGDGGATTVTGGGGGTDDDATRGPAPGGGDDSGGEDGVDDAGEPPAGVRGLDGDGGPGGDPGGPGHGPRGPDGGDAGGDARDADNAGGGPAAGDPAGVPGAGVS